MYSCNIIRFSPFGFALLILTSIPSLAVSLDAEEFEWANQVVHENGSAKITENDDWQRLTTNDETVVDDVDFYLYTQTTKDFPVVSRLSDDVLFFGKFDASKPTKILTHGFYSGKDKFFGKTTREAYLSRYDYNIINVDWSKEADTPRYDHARNRVPDVGYTVALFIDKLASQTSIRPEQLHLVGHSLGAHISGVAGLHVQSGRIMRITGLDPAGPMFSYKDTERLKPEAAEFVDVIHTCGHGLGFYDALGHVDFYPNHGVPSQPGCKISLGKCSHARAVELFAESMGSPEGFVARKCDHWKDFLSGNCDVNPVAFMGEHASWNARGRFWLKTSSKFPYALGTDASFGKFRNSARTSHVFSFYAVFISTFYAIFYIDI